MAKKGIPGYWRIMKNAVRFALRVQERPITPEAWSRLFEEAGFAKIEITSVVAEAGVVKGTKPGERRCHPQVSPGVPQDSRRPPNQERASR